MQQGDNQNPYSPPEKSDDTPEQLPSLGEPIARLAAVDLLAKKEEWNISLYPDRVRCSRPGVSGLDVMRDGLFEIAELHDSGALRYSLQLRTGKKHIFQFSQEEYRQLNEWVDPLTRDDLKAVLKHRFKFVLALGIIFMGLSLPMDGDPAAGLEPIPFDTLDFCLGLSLALLAVTSKFVTHRVFFLFDSLWFALLAASLIYDIFTGSSWIWALLVFLHIKLILSCVRSYRRFAKMDVNAPPRAAESF